MSSMPSSRSSLFSFTSESRIHHSRRLIISSHNQAFDAFFARPKSLEDLPSSRRGATALLRWRAMPIEPKDNETMTHQKRAEREEVGGRAPPHG